MSGAHQQRKSDPLTPDQLAAHCFVSELRTRIAVQPLPYQYGVESRALESLWEIFGLARKTMKDYPGCNQFAQCTTDMLNTVLRPVTAKWHRAHEAGILNSKDGANSFRADLADLQIKLSGFVGQLKEIAYGDKAQPDQMTPEVMGEDEIQKLFLPVRFGIDTADKVIVNAPEINSKEVGDITARRRAYGIRKTEDFDAVGIALSGGGIRSSTFCLGIIQVLADRGLMEDFDYMSTVSGGGYTGTFITSALGAGKSYNDIAKPYGPDTEAVRYVRQNAKYLRVGSLKHGWMMVTGAVAGLLLNWTALFSILILMALVSNFVDSHEISRLCLGGGWKLGVFISIISIIYYGREQRLDRSLRWANVILGVSSGFVLLVLAVIFIDQVYFIFKNYYVNEKNLGYAYLSLFFNKLALGVMAFSVVWFLLIFTISSIKRAIFNFIILGAAIVASVLGVSIFYFLRILGEDPHVDVPILGDIDGKICLIALLVFFAIVSRFFLNVNLTGFHKLYRDRLYKTFIHKDDSNKDFRLNQINSGYLAPYHLINATINLPASTSHVLRERKGDFFVFSRHWSGAPSIGYAETERWMTAKREIDLVTAMAISGAAAGSQMGRYSTPILSAILTLLNARLGFWIQKPPNAKSEPALSGVPGFSCLLREMTGIEMSEKSTWLNLSDGGHIENMGVYELLRRRCKFIVCVDGEADPDSTFEGLLTLVRHAQIDFGIHLEPRLDDIRIDPQSKLSRTHSHLFRIHYPARSGQWEKEMGLILYLKLSLTGDEPEILKRYHLANPDFPHQSTLDQFFDEEQFEVYRQLGVHVAEGMFSSALLAPNLNPKNVANWFRQLAKNMLEPIPE